MTERRQSRTINRQEPTEHRLTRSNQIGMARPGHTAAGVEREYDVHRKIRGIYQLDRLRDAVVAKVEIARGETGHRLVTVGHQHIDANR